MDLIASARTEVDLRHEFFVAWFSGQAEPSAMEHSATAFAPDFQMIPPSGSLLQRAEVLTMLNDARSSRGPDFTITVTHIAARLVGPDLALLVYDEEQTMAGKVTRRRSSALFGPDAQAPQGVVWHHLQETWIT